MHLLRSQGQRLDPTDSRSLDSFELECQGQRLDPTDMLLQYIHLPLLSLLSLALLPPRFDHEQVGVIGPTLAGPMRRRCPLGRG